jgi:hypothetical protein
MKQKLFTFIQFKHLFWAAIALGLISIINPEPVLGA